MHKDEKIDFVVLWVDPNDKKWREQYSKYAAQDEHLADIDNGLERYRDWGLFKYWFRGVEKFAPWVNRIFLVTCNHVPDWLEANHPKLQIIKHSEFMPKDALPTFNSNAIELCLHKIPNLSEHFVLFNDDVFITKKVKPTDYFKNGVPINTMALFAISPSTNGQNFYKTIANNITIINKYFDFRTTKRKNSRKFLSLKQREWILFTYPLLLYRQFMGFRNYHISASYSKKTFLELWSKEPDVLTQTVMSRFRNNEGNVNHWLFNYWQFASGAFFQRNAHFGLSILISDTSAPKYISKQKYHELCLNDTINIKNLEDIQSAITKSFERILPDKCSFEKGMVGDN